MKKKILLSLLPILLVAGFAGRAEAYTALGEVGQSTDVGVYLFGGDSAPTAAGAVLSSISGTVNDTRYGGSSSTFNSQARAAPGTVGTYVNLSYSNGGGYQASASAYSGTILELTDLAHANQQVGITFDAVVHGAMTSSGSGIFGNAYAELAYGEYGGAPTIGGGVAGWYNGPSSQAYLIYDNTINGTTTSSVLPASYTYNLTLDNNGYGKVAALLSFSTLATTGGSGWSTSSSGSFLADYYNTVSMSVRSQYDTTIITSQGGWNIISNPAPPVPEPETYAMLLAGLGLLGFTARRRNGVSRQAA